MREMAEIRKENKCMDEMFTLMKTENVQLKQKIREFNFKEEKLQGIQKKIVKMEKNRKNNYLIYTGLEIEGTTEKEIIHEVENIVAKEMQINIKINKRFKIKINMYQNLKGLRKCQKC